MKRVREELKINFEDLEDVAPIICGTVVNGGFKRKLKMLRADMFCTLACTHSSAFVATRK